MQKSDIQSREDIILLVDSFYQKVQVDEKIGHIFSEIIGFQWDTHIPVMYNFWSTMLLGEQSYKGNPMEKHIALNKIIPLSQADFDRWLELFFGTADSLFEGVKTEEAKNRARSIAQIMLLKLA
jgi:hemoglobin